ncbi:hypothetical protein B0H14DRAFT_2596916 [Mycena olivaceomarginata]|nr:hypothetical protein B0H14DRAFT_2596916 [Mycena olivaceomarginata]
MGDPNGGYNFGLKELGFPPHSDPPARAPRPPAPPPAPPCLPSLAALPVGAIVTSSSLISCCCARARFPPPSRPGTVPAPGLSLAAVTSCFLPAPALFPPLDRAFFRIPMSPLQVFQSLPLPLYIFIIPIYSNLLREN